MTSPGQAQPSYTTGTSLSLLALITWLLIQLTALLVAVLRVPLWARSPSPGDSVAIDVMLVVQIVFAALLFPVLFVNWRTAATLVLVSIPFVEFAGLLAGVSRPRMLLASSVVCLWQVALWLIAPAARRSRATSVACVAIVSAMTLGGPLLLYLRHESLRELPFDWTHASQFGPVMTALAVAHSPTLSHRSFHFILAVVAVSALVRALTALLSARRRQVVH